jgi:hypothetical protein
MLIGIFHSVKPSYTFTVVFSKNGLSKDFDSPVGENPFSTLILESENFNSFVLKH